MTLRTTRILQLIAFYVLLLNPFHGLLKKWSEHLPAGWEVVPFLFYFLLSASAVFVSYRYANSPVKVAHWLVPIILLAFAVGIYLRW